MGKVSSHVLDTSLGKPAAGIKVSLEFNGSDGSSPKWNSIGTGVTNEDGRVPELASSIIEPGHYRISFLVSDYFKVNNTEAFYPVVRIEFNLIDAEQHYHVPLLLNPFGYSTYRGS